MSPLSLLLVAALTSCARPQAGIVLTPYHATGNYRVGETVGWTVSGPPDTEWAYRIKRNNQDLVASGSLRLTNGKSVIEQKGDRPEMLFVEVSGPGIRRMTFGAAVSPERLRPVVPRPRDFDDFWRRKIAELEAIPPNPSMIPGDSRVPDIFYATLRMDSTKGTHVYGQIAWPTTPGKHPAVLILQWASPPYPLDPSWVIGLARQGWIALNVEPHDVLPTEPRSYYAALPNELKHYESVGADDRDKSYFVDMYLRGYRAADYLTQRRDWDGKTLVVTGGSMGGQQSICLAGLHPRITHLIVEEPAGCDLDAGLHGRQEGYPFLSVRDPKIAEAARYVDCVNFATHIHAAALVAMGYTDDIAPPTGIWTAFNLMRGSKEAAPMPEAPHNNIATREQQKPYFDRSAAWLSALVKGQPIPQKHGEQ